MMGTLWNVRESWAKCHTCAHFNTGATTTSRVEGINAVIHKVADSRTLLKDLAHRLDAKIAKTDNADTSLITGCNSTDTIANRYFPEIDQQLQEIVTPPIL